MELKYVRTRLGEIIVFPKSLVHSEIKFQGEVLSAGFIRFVNTRECICYGKSISLSVKSRKDDTEIANIQFFND